MCVSFLFELKGNYLSPQHSTVRGVSVCVCIELCTMSSCHARHALVVFNCCSPGCSCMNSCINYDRMKPHAPRSSTYHHSITHNSKTTSTWSHVPLTMQIGLGFLSEASARRQTNGGEWNLFCGARSNDEWHFEFITAALHLLVLLLSYYPEQWSYTHIHCIRKSSHSTNDTWSYAYCSAG